MKDVGEKIKKRRKELGWTQERLSQVSGISRSKISQLEQGTLEELGFRKVLRVLTALGLSFNIVRVDPTPRLDELQKREFDENSDNW